MKKLLGLAAAVVAFVASPAGAATCQFNLSGAITEPGPFFGSPLLANFTLNCSPVISSRTAPGDPFPFFQIDNVPGLFDGPGAAGPNGTGTGPITAGDIQFYATAGGGGFGVNYPAATPVNGGFGLFSLTGPTVFNDDLDNPTFLPGVYTFDTDFFYGDADATLTITRIVDGAVPEPATWAMMVLGFGAVGQTLRSRKRVQVRFA